MSGPHQRDKIEIYDYWLNGALGAVTLVAFGIAYLIVMYPFQAMSQTVRTEIKESQGLIDKALEVTRSHQAFTAEFEEAKRAAQQLSTRIPATPRESDFLSQICQLANETGLEVADYHPGGIETLENHHEMEVKINARGEYPALCRFLKQVDEVPRLCRLVQMQVATNEKSSGLDIDFVFRIYFAPPAPQPSAA